MDKSLPAWAMKESQMKSLATETLRTRLNKLYTDRKNLNRLVANDSLFEYLWDIKEMALMEGRSTVQVPEFWLEELELASSQLTHRGH